MRDAQRGAQHSGHRSCAGAVGRLGSSDALCNLIGNCVATVVVAWEGDLDREKAAKVLSGEEPIDVTAG